MIYSDTFHREPKWGRRCLCYCHPVRNASAHPAKQSNAPVKCSIGFPRRHCTPAARPPRWGDMFSALCPRQWSPSKRSPVLFWSPRTARSRLWEPLLPADIRATSGQAPRQRVLNRWGGRRPQCLCTSTSFSTKAPQTGWKCAFAHPPQ